GRPRNRRNLRLAVATAIARGASNPNRDEHAYSVLLDVNGHTKHVSIDSQTGAMIADSRAVAVTHPCP
ncbi:MAG: hypothetical protein KDI32_01275, partial [Pseudomonadales bacterium]|nr:hypothetical protein [Pseudomonadales bacterium]